MKISKTFHFLLIGLLSFTFIVNGCWWGSKESKREQARIEKYKLRKSRGRAIAYRGVAPVKAKKNKTKKKRKKYKGPMTFYAVASYYGRKFHGKRTASGEIFNMFDYTAAHKTLPFGTLVKVTNLKNHRAVVVRINDRGPFVKGRDLDLSYAAAKALGMIIDGTAKVKVEILRIRH
jgi:rare lipoprotein A